MSVAATVITEAQLLASGTTPIVLTGAYGELTINGFNAATGQVDYAYTLTANADHSGGDVIDGFGLILTDNDGDTLPGTLGVLIVDDQASATDDTNSVTEDTGVPATGNVVTANDVVGADTTATPVSGIVAGSGSPAGSSANVGASVTGIYGDLTLNADGSYSYALDNSNPLVQGLGSTESLTETYSYEITDSDGDTATATLIITINGADDPLSITDSDDNGVAGADSQVLEADLASGSNAAGTGEKPSPAPLSLPRRTALAL